MDSGQELQGQSPEICQSIEEEISPMPIVGLDETEFEEVVAVPSIDFEKSIGDLGTVFPTAVDIGRIDIEVPRSGTRVRIDPSRNVYLSMTSSTGNLQLWRVTSGRFIFSSNESPPRYITSHSAGGRWYAVWKDGEDPVSATEHNMSTDPRVWQVFEKFSDYFLRSEMDKKKYLHSQDGKMKIMIVDHPENTRGVSPLSLN